jgi:uncharacterized protein YndB with AHSA1/START domain
MKESSYIQVEVTVNKPRKKVWEFWTKPKHIVNWNFATDEWKCPKATNDLRVDGQFTYVMAAKDGTATFDFSGTYTKIDDYERITYALEDGREVTIQFIEASQGTQIIESFEVEETNSDTQQQDGWQAILSNFKKYAEDHE